MAELKKLLPLDELNKLASGLNIFNGKKHHPDNKPHQKKTTIIIYNASLRNNKHNGLINISDVIYPSEGYVVKQGRLNNINESIFHLLSGYHIDLSEEHENIDGYIQLTGLVFNKKSYEVLLSFLNI